ncbi:MAG: peptidylprolyl isomerase [Ruminococcaceae bacterium]|nr:peptidylprolyl isomerase [Oscillospiraceae bacterium]
MKKLILIILAAILSVSFVSCSKKDYNVTEIDGYIVEESKAPTNYVRIVMKNGDAMLLELYPDEAPITVANFKKLVSEKYYDGIIFHRVISGFMIQGGDPDGDGYSNNDRPNIKGEFNANGVINRIKHERGVISMARSKNPDSASTQFFIVHQTSVTNSESLNGQYAAFGKLLAGYGTLDKIASVKTGKNDKPKSKQQMAEVRFVNIVSTPTTPDTE